MILGHRLPGRLWVVALVLAIVGTGRIARAQDDEVVEDDAVERAAPNQIDVFNQPNFDQVDNWVFGRFGGSAAARARFDSALELRIDDLDRALGVTEAQKRKLTLAGRGDIKRIFDRVEELKRKFLQNQNDPNNNIWQAIQPLQVEVNAGQFGEGSLFQKTIKKTFNDDQSARYDSLMRERKLSRYRSTVEWFVVHLDKALGFSDDQRRRLTELIMNDSEPPLKFGQSDYFYLLFQVSKLPEAKIKPILDNPQWRLLSRQFMQARGMEQWLRMNGILADHNKDGGNAALPPSRIVPAMALQPAVALPGARRIPPPAAPAATTKKVFTQEKVEEKKKD